MSEAFPDATMKWAAVTNEGIKYYASPGFGPDGQQLIEVTIVQVGEIVEPGQLDPESIVTPGIFVDRVVAIANPAHESELVEAGVSYP